MIFQSAWLSFRAFSVNQMRKFARIAVGIWFFTFVLFFAVSIPEGAAITGKIESGHYYVGSHSDYKEVSRTWYVFNASLTAVVGLATLAVFPWAIWNEAREKDEPPFHPLRIVFALISLLVGCMFFFGSLSCILAAVRK